MSNRIVIIGAGYSGERLALAALGEGREVCVTSRDATKLERLEAAGARVARWGALEPETDAALEALCAPGCAVVYSVPTIFREREGTRHVEPVRRAMRAAARGGARRFVYYSSTSVYGDHASAWIDEDAERAPISELGRMRVDIEEMVLAQGADFEAVNVARLVGIYGPGRTLVDYVRRGVYKVARADKITNRIHVDDIVGATLALVDRGPDGPRVYDFADGSPLAISALVEFLVDRLGMDPPATSTLEEVAARSPSAAARWKAEYRCRGQRMRDELGYEPAHADAIAGYDAMIRAGELSW